MSSASPENLDIKPAPDSRAAPTQRTRVIKAAFYFLLPSVVSNALPVISMPLLTRALDPSDFGLVALAQVYGLIVFGLANCGLQWAYERNYFKYKNDPRSGAALFWNCFLFISILGTVLSLLTSTWEPIVERYILRSSAPPFFVMLAAFSAVFRGANQIPYQYLRNSEQPKPFAALAVLEGVLSFALTLSFVIGGEMGIVGVVLAQTLASALVGLALLIVSARQIPFILDLSVFRDSIKLGSPLVLRTFIGLASNQVDKYMLGLVSVLGQVGIYSLGQRIAQIVFFLMNSMDYVFIPHVYKLMFAAREPGHEHNPQREIGLATDAGRFMTPFIFVSSATCLCVAIFAEEALRILAAHTFHGAIEIAAALSLYYSTLIFGKVNGRQLLFGQKTFLTSGIAVISIGVNAAVLFPAIHYWGAPGAAWGMLVASFVASSLSHFQAQRCFRIRWEYGRIINIFALLFIAVIIHVVTFRLGLPYPLRLCFKAVVVGLFATLGWKFGYLDRRTLTALPLGRLFRKESS